MAERRGMNDERFTKACEALIQGARDYMDAEVLPDTERAWRYYDRQVDAEPMGFVGLDGAGNKVYEGSRVVVTECADTLHQMLPELYRTFTASDEAVVFEPSGAEDVAGAEQATLYANHVFFGVNPGEELLNTALTDWGVKFAALKVWWEEVEERQERRFWGLDETALEVLRADDEIVELEADEPDEDEDGAEGYGGMTQLWGQVRTEDGQTLTMAQPVQLYNGRLVHARKVGKICIDVIPHEELLLDGDAQRMEDARIVGQDGYRTVAEVVALGIPEAKVLEKATSTQTDTRGGLTTQARTGEGRLTGYTADMEPSLQFVRVVEANVRLDKDGDGLAETYRIIALGEAPEVVDWEQRDDAVYVVSSPFEKAHKVVGTGIVETTTDLQDIATSLFRRTLDNLNRSINPRPMVKNADGRVMDDLLSWFGGPIRTDEAGQIEWFTVPFTASAAFPLLEYVEARRGLRTGITPAGAGLDPNALKGQTLEGVQAMVQAPQSRIEYLARRFALGVMKPLFRAVLKLSVQFQDQPAVVRLRNQWIAVDPRGWNAKMDAAPNVGLGTGTRFERLAALQMIAAKQEQLLAAGSPLVTLEHYRNTLAKIVELVGERDVERYLRDFQPGEAEALEQQQQQAQAQAAQAAMQMELAKEQAKAQAKAEVEQLKAQLDAQLEQLKAENARQKVDYEHELRVMRLEMEKKLELLRMQIGSPAGNALLRLGV